MFLVGGAAGYAMVDSWYEVEAYIWLVLWYCFFTFNTVSGISRTYRFHLREFDDNEGFRAHSDGYARPEGVQGS